ncbi:MAG: glycerophosphodiester phosphodiesterase family protein [Proteobacteria bacterium]|nr:glycerophosphodiester phosphodiesterase family protein [Pseudomonadota bacterium]
MRPKWCDGAPAKPWVIAHRGYSAIFVENSLESFTRAIAAGADLIETDVRLGREGVLICNHDTDLKRVKNQAVAVTDLRAGDLGEHAIAELAEVLEVARGRAGVLLDVKLEDEDFPARILAEVGRLGMTDEVVFGLRTLAQTRALRSHAAGVAILGLFRDYGEYPAFFAAGGDIARLWEEDIGEEALGLAHGSTDNGGEHPVWVTSGLRGAGEAAGEIDAGRLKGLMEIGIDGILVNDPVQALGARAEFDGSGPGKAE